ncbi:MAG: helix-turn-helix transcriptional regulator [Candidatus Omnitrophica bacterium]|nr:helix-turn-helix transcriptional regulator [Candidatus Omnitrophota bacterium]
MKDSIRLKFAQKIKKLRKSRGLTQEELADLTAIDYKYIQRLEGKNPPAVKIDTIQRIAKALKVDPSKLLGG